MSILIKGVKLPKKQPMRIVLNPNGQLFVDHRTFFEEYEAVELPDHGDLIDKSILIDELAISEEPDDCRGCASYNSYDDFCCRSLDFQNMCRSIRTAPVVIPAERSE